LLGRLSDARGFTPWLRDLRAIEVLERVNEAQAREALAALSKGVAGHRVTEHARDARRRLTLVTPKPQPRPALADKSLPPHAYARLGTLRVRHELALTSLTYSKSGKTLATADDNTVYLWKADSGAEINRFKLDPGAIVCASPRALAIVSHKTRIVDMETGKSHTIIVERSAATRDASGVFLCGGLSADGSRLCLGLLADGGEQFAHVWDTQSGKLLTELPLPKDRLIGRLSPDAKTLLVMSRTQAAEL